MSDSSNTTSDEDIIGISLRRSATSKETMNAIISNILVDSTNVDGVMVPAYGAISRAARKFGVSKYTASRVFARGKNNSYQTTKTHLLQAL
jgi:hypothetical protein